MQHHTYLSATRHPWPCLLFLLPLLACYEAGVVWLNTAHPEVLRNGADAWLRVGLAWLGLRQMFWAPVMVVGILVVWSLFRADDRPDDVLGIWSGMAIESVLVALGLWALSRGLGPFLDQLGVVLSLPPTSDVAVGKVVTYVGAGIYEEVLFRLFLFSLIEHTLSLAELPSFLTVGAAAISSAGLFAAAHHVGPSGEPFNNYVFTFRTLAGIYFALVFRLRGFGIAVGGHACYDVIAGVAIG